MRRPLVPVAVFFLAGTVLAHYWNAPLWAAAMACALCLAAALALLLVKRKHAALGAFLLLVTFLGLLNLRFRADSLPGDTPASAPPADRPPAVHIEGVVADAPGYGEKLLFNDAPEFKPYGDSGKENARARVLAFTVNCTAAQSAGKALKVEGPVRVFVYRFPRDVSDEGRQFADMIVPGARVVLNGDFAAPAAPSNPGQFDYAGYLRGSGVSSMLYVRGVKGLSVQKPATFSLTWHIGYVKETIARAYYRNFSRDNAAMLSALLIGERQSLPDTLMDDMSTSGTAHFIAISGMNLAIIAGFAYFLLRLMMIPYKAQRVLLITGIILYSLMVGLSPPVFRSTIMLVLILLAQLLGRRGDTLNVLALAAIVIVAARPDDVMNIGYQLSFIAVFCLVVFTKPIGTFVRNLPARLRYWFSRDRHDIGFAAYQRILALLRQASPWWWRAGGHVWDGAALAVATSVAAWLGTFPIILFNFGKFSIWTAAANLVMFPIMDLWMLLGFLLLIATLFQAVFGWTFLLVPVFLGHARAIAAIEWPAHFFSLLPMSFKNIPQTSVAAILVMYCGIASLLLWRRLRWMRYATAAVMIVAAVVVVWPLAAEAQTGEFEITVLDVGHGGATFIRFPDGRTVLYDCGSYRESDVARRIIQPFLRERGITHLDAVIISHPHVDHFDGLPTLLENYRVKTLVLTDYFTPDVNKYWAAVWPAIQDSGARIVRMKDGGTLDGFPELSFILAKVSLPPRESENYNATLNETSLVTRVECDGLSLLLTGDIEEQGIAWFNSRYNGPPVDVLVSPHHGDYESHDLTVTMMKKLRPRAVIVSTDRRMIKESLRSAIEKKESGKPASATGPAGDTTRIYLTRASGAITIKTNSKTTYVHETLKQEN